MLTYDSILKDNKIGSYLKVNVRVLSIFRNFLILILIFFLSLLFLPWTPSVSSLGQVIAFDPNNRVQLIESPIEGRVQKWHVQEGSSVEKNDLIAEIVDIDPSRLDRLKNKVEAINQRLAALNKLETRAKKHVDRMESLYSRGIESKRSFELAEIDFFKIINEKNKVEVEFQDLSSRISRQNSQNIMAPSKGTIMNIYTPAETGVLRVGEVIAKIVPSDVSPAVELLVNGRDLFLVKQGQNARVVFEGWPAVQVMGWPSIAIGTFPGIIKVIDQGGDGNGNFRIIVVPDGTTEWPEDFIRMGAKAKGWVQLKRVPLWWDLWRRFSGVPPSV